ncbi:eIF3 [Acrasis kona]|uniref:EIF3 n=1 Tax=Acrasis kona TaxID=1008807 RepID=A0AAW2Z238_9EUKA
MSSFQLPTIRATGDWGPPDTEIPEKFRTLPTQFNHIIANKNSIHLGKVADWTQEVQTPYYQQQQHKEFKQATQQELGPDLEDFSVVSGAKYVKHAAKKRAYGTQVQARGTNYPRTGTRGTTRNARGGRGGRGAQAWTPWDARKPGSNPTQNKSIQYKSSVQIKSTFEPVAKFTFVQLSKLSSVTVIPKGEDLKKCGHVDFYDKKFDKATSKVGMAINKNVVQQRAFFNVTTSEDPIMNLNEVQEKGNVFATDVILSALMASTKSVHSWDVVARKVDGKIWFDKRRHSPLDLLTVNETAKEAPSTEDKDRDHINSAVNLSIEATVVNQCFSQQILQRAQKPTPGQPAPAATKNAKPKEERIQFGEPNPFAAPKEDANDNQSTTESGVRSSGGNPQAPPASIGYKYRMWELSDDIRLVCRCEVDAAVSGNNASQPTMMATVRALTEYEPGSKNDWASKLDSQRGTVLVSEYKNNSAKMSRWILQALLANTEIFKLGFVTRTNSKNNNSHALIAVETTKPVDFVRQFSINVGNMWSIIKTIIETIQKQPNDGKFLIVKLPNKQEIQILSVPENELNDDDDDMDDDMDDDDMDDDGSSVLTGQSEEI